MLDDASGDAMLAIGAEDSGRTHLRERIWFDIGGFVHELSKLCARSEALRSTGCAVSGAPKDWRCTILRMREPNGATVC